MVCENIHIICGNCGQDLTEKGMSSWEYKPAEIDEETGDVYDTADVYIRCENCATIHFLDDHIEAFTQNPTR